MLSILYEDNHVIAVDKPAGIAVQAARPGERDLLAEVKAFLKERDKKPGNVFLGLVHRLDRPVSGVVLFAKTSKGASRLSSQIRARTMEKIYEATVHGTPNKVSGTLEHRLEKISSSSFPRKRESRGDEEGQNVYKAIVSARGKPASLTYTTLDATKDTAHLRITLETGRFHQIRAQLTAIGHPIVGDTLYGSTKKIADHHIELRAASLSFDHVITGERIIVHSVRY